LNKFHLIQLSLATKKKSKKKEIMNVTSQHN